MKKISVFLFALQAVIVCAQAPATIDTLTYCIRTDGVGAGGFDVVSYFQGAKPVAGNKTITAKHKGVTYWFSNSANKDTFLAKAEAYLPQFGGWCSMTLAMGRATTPTYDNFAILNGKLYLFERTLSVNGRELWLMDIAGNEKIAIKNYQAYRATGKIQ
jgi:YHS domain-containing protein